jgi:hypothetical protein
VSVVALTIVLVLELISCDIFFTFKNGVEPTAKRGNSSEYDVYLFTRKNKKLLKQSSTKIVIANDIIFFLSPQFHKALNAN